MLLEAIDIAKTFTSWQGWPVPRKVSVRALDGVSFTWTTARRWAWWANPVAASQP